MTTTLPAPGGADVPVFGLDTTGLADTECIRAVAAAIQAGCRRIDAGTYADNVEEVVTGVARSGVPREEVFVTVPVVGAGLDAGDVVSRTRRAADHFGDGDGPDLLLVGGSERTSAVEDLVGAAGRLRAEGVVDHVGIEDCSLPQLRRAIGAAAGPVATNRVVYGPHRERHDLLSFCIDRGILLSAREPLDRGGLADDDLLGRIADERGLTAEQVALRWLFAQPGVVAVLSPVSRYRLRQLSAALDAHLSDADVVRIFERRGPLPDRVRERLDLAPDAR